MDKLQEIIAHKKQQVAAEMLAVPLATMKARVADRGRGFYSLATALRQAAARHTLPLIAELKKSSPSRGIIRADFAAIPLAQDYLQAGATALSILCEEKWFGGSLTDLKAVGKMTRQPLLQKDFIFCDYQIYQAAAAGADVILLILSHLDDKLARQLEETALKIGLEVLLETHNMAEIKRANSMASPLIGVNNRDLTTLQISLTTGQQLLGAITADKLAIAESGLGTAGDVASMWQAGARGFLIGEHFMKQPDVFVACQDFITASNQLLFSS